MSMELQLTPAQVEITQGIANKAYLKNELASQLEYYKSIEVTEETMKDAKSDRADLNKLRTAIDNQRKAVKKHFTELYKPFDDDCKELIAMIDEPIGMIDCQVAVLGDKKKQEKRQAIEEFFSQICTADFVKLDDVLNPKWGNATMKLQTIKDELAAEVQRISDDYAEICKLYADSPMLTAIKQRYEQTRDKGAALAYAAEIERREQAERERKEAAERAKAEQERRESEQAARTAPQAQPFDDLPDMAQKPAEAPSEPVGAVTFTVTGTKSQIIAIRDFMKANNINFTVKR